MKILSVLIIMAGMLSGQVLYEEYFTGGNMQLNWHPWFTDSLGIGDSMGVINDTTSPGGDDWAGIIRNEYMGMAGLTYAGISTLTDYSIEAWIFTNVRTSPGGAYNGIAWRMNPSNRYYYRLVSDFDSDARIRLGLIASGAMPVVLRDWGSGEIPGGVPTISSWHRFSVTMISDSIWCYYDNNLLPGCPILNDSVTQGYFGIYTFSMDSIASTICDNIIVSEAISSLSELNENIVAGLSTTPNPFSDNVRISIDMQEDHMSSPIHLGIYDITGRLVKTFNTIDSPTLHHILKWDGTNNAHEKLSNGTYLLVIRIQEQIFTQKLILIR